MPTTIQTSQSSNVLPNGLNENDLFLHLGLPIETSSDFPDIHQYVVTLASAATDAVENFVGIDFRSKSYKTIIDHKGFSFVFLRPNIDTTTFQIVKSDNSALNNSDYHLDSQLGTLSISVPIADKLTVSWTTLNTPLPAGIKGVILALTSEMFNKKSSVPNINDDVKYYLSSFRLVRTLA